MLEYGGAGPCWRSRQLAATSVSQCQAGSNKKIKLASTTSKGYNKHMGKTYKDKREFWDTSRDIYQLMLINGATKANVHKDRKRESNKKKCRDAVDSDRGEW